jgi:type IV pilus assembly protein PilV
MSKSNTRSARSRPHEGFTLLEVLIALLVMSIGLLGIGKIMMLSARANDSALMRGQATALAWTILDAMRANRQAALNVGVGYDTALGVVPAAVVCTVAAPCNSTQQAQNDLNLWGQSLAAGLPAGVGSVVTAAAVDAAGLSNVTATVTVQWADTVAQQAFGGTGNNVSIVLETVL